jgi:hypothetical protein
VEEHFEIFGKEYEVVSIIQHKPGHFVSLVKSPCGKWNILDDVCNTVVSVRSFTTLLNHIRGNNRGKLGFQVIILMATSNFKIFLK